MLSLVASLQSLWPPIADRHGFALVVINKALNIGERAQLIELLTVLRDISRDIPLVWPMHPRVEAQMRKYRLDNFIAGDRISRLPAQAYPEYVGLMRSATCVLTDSWNAQEEATALGVPCLTVGSYPEHAITVSMGITVAG